MCVFLGPPPKPCPSCKLVAFRECKICKGFGFIIEGPDSMQRPIPAWDWVEKGRPPTRNLGRRVL